MWVEYSSKQSSNSFEASFKKRLDPSCKSLEIAADVNQELKSRGEDDRDVTFYSSFPPALHAG